MGDLKIERHFPVSPETVFSFVTETNNLVKWWGPEGTSLGDHNLDFTKLGDWFFILIDPNGGHHRVSGVVLEINPPHWVEFTLIVHEPDGPPSIDSLVRFEVKNDGETGTLFVLTQFGLTRDEIVKGSTQGWVSTLTRLETLLIELNNQKGN